MSYLSSLMLLKTLVVFPPSDIRLQAEKEAHHLERVCECQQERYRRVPGAGGGGGRHAFVWTVRGEYGDVLQQGVRRGEQRWLGFCLFEILQNLNTSTSVGGTQVIVSNQPCMCRRSMFPGKATAYKRDLQHVARKINFN